MKCFQKQSAKRGKKYKSDRRMLLWSYHGAGAAGSSNSCFWSGEQLLSVRDCDVIISVIGQTNEADGFGETE